MVRKDLRNPETFDVHVTDYVVSPQPIMPSSLGKHMKNRYIPILLGLALLTGASCSKEELAVTYFSQQGSITDGDNDEDSLMERLGLVEYDSVRFSDGSYAVHSLRNSPQNSLTEFFDDKGRTIATVSRASECYAQTLVYNYDEAGRLSHLLRFKREIFEGLEPDTAGYERNEEGYLGFRQMIVQLDYEHPDTARYEQTNIEYDRNGDAVRAYVVYGKDRIVAPDGYKLEVAVQPCLSFWQSDINGGFYVFHVRMEPKNKNQSAYKVCRFADFMPSVESDYRNGYIVKTIWHRHPGMGPDDADRVFISVRVGELNVYSATWNDGSKHQRAYKNGLLSYTQTVSKYGTLLEKETYTFLPNNKAKVAVESMDNPTKTLKTQSVSIIDVPHPEAYQEDMNVDCGDFRWENYYFK